MSLTIASAGQLVNVVAAVACSVAGGVAGAAGRGGAAPADVLTLLAALLVACSYA